jgi:hypothetical protein
MASNCRLRTPPRRRTALSKTLLASARRREVHCRRQERQKDAKALNEMGGLKDALMKGAQAVKPATISLIILQSYAVHGQ